MAIQRIRFQEKTIEFETQGRGKTPLILLHGFCEDRSVWQVLMPKLIDFRVVRMDLAGFGGSDLPAEPSLAWQAEAVGAVFDFLKISPRGAVLVGHSMGGYVALEFAKRQAERLAGLGLFHSHPFADSPERIGFRQKAIDFIHKNGLHDYCRQLFPPLFAPDFLEKNAEPLQFLTARARKFQPEGVVAAIEAMIGRLDHSATLAAADFPVLFILGEKDALLPLDQLLAQTHLAPLAEIHLLVGVGHMGMFEATDETAKILHDFHDFCKKRLKKR